MWLELLIDPYFILVFVVIVFASDCYFWLEKQLRDRELEDMQDRLRRLEGQLEEQQQEKKA
jgi:hypothetical protein